MPKKQSDGRYRAKVKVGDRYVYVSAHTVKELEAEKVRIRKEYIDGTQARDMTFAELVVEWWEKIKYPSIKAENTIITIRSVVNKWILPNIDERKLAKAIRRVDLQEILNTAKGKVSLSLIRRIKFVLNEVNAYGMEIGAMSANYAHNLIEPDSKETHKDRRISLTDEQVQKIFVAAKGSFIEELIHLLYFYGLRIGEAEALTWGDIDFQKKVIHITKSRTGTGAVSKTKTTSGVRTIDIPNASLPYLKSKRGLPGAYVVQERYRLAKYDELLRILAECGLAKPKAIQKSLHKYAGNYESDITFHTFRHTYVTSLFDAGVDPVSASRIMGHSSYAITADIYTAISDGRKQSNRDKINSFFDSKKVAK